MAFQSNEEMIRVADEWFRNFCPPNLVKDGTGGTKNAELILNRCLRKHGIVAISGMTESAHELAGEGVLALIPEPKQPTQDEKAADFQKREFIRIQKEQAENDQNAFYDRVLRAGEARKLEKEAKEQADAETTINNEILRYECYAGPNRVDHGKSDAFRKDLFKIEVRRNGKRDAKLTLEAVRKAISKLP